MSPNLLTLPRELRDMIYSCILTSSVPAPSLHSTSSPSLWCRPWEPKSGLGNNGCAFSARRAPNTCANFLATCKQVNEEMTWVMQRLKRKGKLGARMDCMSDGVGGHWFTWLAIPIVSTSTPPSLKSPSSLSSSLSLSSAASLLAKKESVVPAFLGRYLQSAYVRGEEAGKRITTIEQLRIDIRVFQGGKQEVEVGRDRTSWAICAALKHVFEHDPEIIPTRDCRNEILIREVVLDILPQENDSRIGQSSFIDDNDEYAQPTDAQTEPVEMQLAKELVDVWNSLWTADSYKARYYRNLLERIGKVKVEIDGKTYRCRELGDELKRGKKERRRIEMRGGWWGTNTLTGFD